MEDLTILIVTTVLGIILTVYKIGFEKEPETKIQSKLHVNEDGVLVSLDEISIK